jgi:integrase
VARNPKKSGETITVGNTSVKLYTFRRGERSIYSLNNYVSGKRQVRQFSDYGEAKREAQSIARRLEEGQRKVFNLTDDDAATYVRALGYLKSTGHALDFVVKEYADAREILGGQASLIEAARFWKKLNAKVKPKLIPEIVQELLASRAKKSERHVRDLRERLGRFARDNNGYIANLTHNEVAIWLRELGLSGRSHDNFRQAIILLFRFAQKWSYLPEGKTEADKVEPMGNDSDGEIEIFTVDEMTRLLKAATNDVLPYLALGAFAGIRTAEIVRLDWQEINFETGYIEIKKSKAKTKGRRLITMQPNLVEWLKKARKRSGPVTPLARPEKTASEVVGAKLEPALEWKRNGLRHSYCSYRMAITQDENIVSAEMGNSAQMIYANYRQLVTREQAQAWFSIAPEVDDEQK